jgi:hypothetical protein
MSTEEETDGPVTKRELYQVLDVWGGAFEARLDAKLDALFRASTESVRAELERMRARLSGELAQHTNRIVEETQKMLGGFEEKYKTLPDRIDALERAWPPPMRQRRR